MPVYKYRTAKGKTLYYVKYNNITKRGFETKSAAKKYELELMVAPKDPTPTVTYYDVAMGYLEYQKNNSTFGTYQKSLNLFQKFIQPNIPNKKIDKYTELECEQFRTYVNGLPNSTEYKNDILARFKGIFKFACKYYGLEKDPTRYMQRLKKSFEEKQKKINMIVWDETEFERFITTVDKPQYQALFTTLYYTGMRLGEALALNWNDVSDHKISITKSLTRKTDKGTYEIKEPKTVSSIRRLELNDSLYKYLMAYKDSQKKIPGFNDSWFVFGNILPLAQVSIDREKDRAVRISGVKRIRIHDFRHSHASNLIANGANIVAVSKRLGHSNINMTLSTYTHLLEKNSEELVNKLEISSQNLLTKLKSPL